MAQLLLIDSLQLAVWSTLAIHVEEDQICEIKLRRTWCGSCSLRCTAVCNGSRLVGDYPSSTGDARTCLCLLPPPFLEVAFSSEDIVDQSNFGRSPSEILDVTVHTSIPYGWL